MRLVVYILRLNKNVVQVLSIELITIGKTLLLFFV